MMQPWALLILDLVLSLLFTSIEVNKKVQHAVEHQKSQRSITYYNLSQVPLFVFPTSYYEFSLFMQ